MSAAAGTPWPAASPIPMRSRPSGSWSTSYQSPQTSPAAGRYRAARSTPGRRGVAVGSNAAARVLLAACSSENRAAISSAAPTRAASSLTACT
jgi:hypothetical protein